MKRAIFALPILILFSSFCNQDKKEEPQNETMQFLVEGDWIHTAYQIDTDDNGSFEEAALPCQLGDVWRFTADNKFQWRDEVEYCDLDVDSVAIIPGTWELRNNDTELHVEIASGILVFDFQIFAINSSKL